MKKLIPRLIATCLSLSAIAAQAQTTLGLTEIPGTRLDGSTSPITVFYPADAPQQNLQYGPYQVLAARGAKPKTGNQRLIVVSHGSGSSPWMTLDLARNLVQAGYVVASPEHEGDNWHDTSKVGPKSWLLRPLEVSQAIDALQKDVRFAGLVDFKRVGVWGMSAGGHTALTLAGGRWADTRLRDHCQLHIEADATGCTGGNIELNGGLFDGIKKAATLAVIRSKFSDATENSHTDPRVKAIIAGVPFAVDFDPASLSNPPVPLGIVQSQKDLWLLPQFHSGPVLAACKTCELVADLPNGGHGALLSPLPVDLPAWLERLLKDPPGFDRTAEMPPLFAKTRQFFDKHLLP